MDSQLDDSMAKIITIPPHIPHVDCPQCVTKNFAQVAVYGKATNPNCKRCGGEGVVREDGKPTLKTKVSTERMV